MHFPLRTKCNKTFAEETSAAVQRDYHTDGAASKSDTEEKFWNTQRFSRQLINQRKRGASKSKCRSTGQEEEAEDKNRMTFTTRRTDRTSYFSLDVTNLLVCTNLGFVVCILAIYLVNGSLGNLKEICYWFPSGFFCPHHVPALIWSYVSSSSLPPATVRHALTDRCSAVSHEMSYGLFRLHTCGIKENNTSPSETIEVSLIIFGVMFSFSKSMPMFQWISHFIIRVTTQKAAEASSVFIYSFQGAVC